MFFFRGSKKTLSEPDILLLIRIVQTGNCWEGNFCYNPTHRGKEFNKQQMCPLYDNGCKSSNLSMRARPSYYKKIALTFLHENCSEEELFDLFI